jgi:septum formation protein
MLRALSGTTHRVVTGVALRTPGAMLVRSVETRVTMRPLSSDEIAAYVASGESAGKAGAYAIQESADRFVDRVDGPFDNVVGLPVATVRAMLARA